MFLTPGRAILSLYMRVYHWQHSEWDMVKEIECFPKSGCEQLCQYRHGTTNPKIINTTRQAISLCQCEGVGTGESQGLCGTCPCVRGTNNTQKTKERESKFRQKFLLFNPQYSGEVSTATLQNQKNHGTEWWGLEEQAVDRWRDK